jgi:hypothetical protein
MTSLVRKFVMLGVYASPIDCRTRVCVMEDCIDCVGRAAAENGSPLRVAELKALLAIRIGRQRPDISAKRRSEAARQKGRDATRDYPDRRPESFFPDIDAGPSHSRVSGLSLCCTARASASIGA